MNSCQDDKAFLRVSKKAHICISCINVVAVLLLLQIHRRLISAIRSHESESFTTFQARWMWTLSVPVGAAENCRRLQTSSKRRLLSPAPLWEASTGVAHWNR